MTHITLPDGCRGVAMDGSSNYTAKPGDQVEVSEGHAAYIRRHAGRSGGGHGEQFAFGTKRSMRCAPCQRVWNAWNTVCPRCGAATREAD